MNKEDLVKAIGSFDEKDLADVLDLLEIINGERYNNKSFNDRMVWSNIKGMAKNFKNPQYKYVEVWTCTSALTSMITEAINKAEADGFRWHDTQYQTSVNSNNMLVRSALLIFKKD